MSILVCSVIGSFFLCLVFGQFGEETKTRKRFRSDEDCHATFVYIHAVCVGREQ